MVIRKTKSITDEELRFSHEQLFHPVHLLINFLTFDVQFVLVTVRQSIQLVCVNFEVPRCFSSTILF